MSDEIDPISAFMQGCSVGMAAKLATTVKDGEFEKIVYKSDVEQLIRDRVTALQEKLDLAESLLNQCSNQIPIRKQGRLNPLYVEVESLLGDTEQ